MIYEQMQMNVPVFSPCVAFKSQKEQPPWSVQTVYVTYI